MFLKRSTKSASGNCGVSETDSSTKSRGRDALCLILRRWLTRTQPVAAAGAPLAARAPKGSLRVAPSATRQPQPTAMLADGSTLDVRCVEFADTPTYFGCHDRGGTSSCECGPRHHSPAGAWRPDAIQKVIVGRRPSVADSVVARQTSKVSRDNVGQPLKGRRNRPERFGLWSRHLRVDITGLMSRRGGGSRRARCRVAGC
jgi:hypothetical protein